MLCDREPAREHARRYAARLLARRSRFRSCFFLVSAKKRNFSLFFATERGQARRAIARARACTRAPLRYFSVCRLVRNPRLAINERNCFSSPKLSQKNAGKRYERNSRVESGTVVKHRNACMKVVRFIRPKLCLSCDVSVDTYYTRASPG